LTQVNDVHASQAIIATMLRRWSPAFARFALVPMLALVFMPSASRLVQAFAAQPQMLMMDGQPCDMNMSDMDMDGMDMSDMGMAGMDMSNMHHPSAGDKHGGHAMPAEGDCAFCPILAALSLPEVFVSSFAALTWPQQWQQSGSFGEISQIAVAGLGARGPPALG
jgi:hypothetical protein